jgi:hypothetical protein
MILSSESGLDWSREKSRMDMILSSIRIPSAEKLRMLVKQLVTQLWENS